MKKITAITVILLLSITAKSINLGLTGCSFDTSAYVATGSAQWVDVKLMSGGYVPSDRVALYIQYKDASGYYNGTLVKIYDTLFYPYVYNLASNADGSKRVPFNLPSTALGRSFKIMVNLAPSTYYGIFNYVSVPTGIRYHSTPQDLPVKEIRYFNLFGQQIPEPSGKYVEQTVYEDDSFSSRLMMVLQ